MFNKKLRPKLSHFWTDNIIQYNICIFNVKKKKTRNGNCQSVMRRKRSRRKRRDLIFFCSSNMYRDILYLRTILYYVLAVAGKIFIAGRQRKILIQNYKSFFFTFNNMHFCFWSLSMLVVRTNMFHRYSLLIHTSSWTTRTCRKRTS